MNNIEKIEIYIGGKESLDILKKAGGKDLVNMRISIPDRTHFKIQNLRQNKYKRSQKALNPGKVFKITAHKAFVEKYAVTRDGTEEQKAIEQAEIKAQAQEQELEAEPEIAE